MVATEKPEKECEYERAGANHGPRNGGGREAMGGEREGGKKLRRATGLMLMLSKQVHNDGIR